LIVIIIVSIKINSQKTAKARSLDLPRL